MKFIIVISYYSGTKLVPAPPSAKELTNNKIKEGGNSQKEILLRRGNAINCVIDLFLITDQPILTHRFRLYHPVIPLQVGLSWPDFFSTAHRLVVERS